MQIHISTNGGVPIYQQIVNQVKYLVASGRLAPGDELPTIRALAERLLVNPNTVARAYRELEAGGLVTTRRRVGTIDQAPPAPASPALQQQAATFVRDARNAGLADEEVVDLVRGALIDLG
jgi:GntR family transcriptional regulator